MRTELRSGQVAAAAGVNVQTLRYYERRRLLVPRQERLCGPTGVGLTRSSAQPRTADTMPQ